MTFKDLTIDIPNLLVSVEMVLFSVSFQYFYRLKEYSSKKGAAAVPLGHGGYQGGFLGLKAIGQALNIFDIIAAMFKTVTGAKQSMPPMTGNGRGVSNPLRSGSKICVSILTTF